MIGSPIEWIFRAVFGDDLPLTFSPREADKATFREYSYRFAESVCHDGGF
jgi:hypothetical protein